MIGVEVHQTMASDPKDWMWAEACAVLERMEQMHRQFFRPGLAGTPAAAWQPPIDMFETADGLRIVVAVPGVEIQDIDIAVEQDVLVVSGIRHLPTLARGADIHRLEIPYGRFERDVRLPSGRFELRHPELAHGCLFIPLAKRK
jgi:HSP20 family molecular chaperone IbpA